MIQSQVRLSLDDHENYNDYLPAPISSNATRVSRYNAFAAASPFMVLSNTHQTGEFVVAYLRRRNASPSRYDAVYGDEYTFGEP